MPVFAKVEEAENLRKFGADYAGYIETKMFTAFLISRAPLVYHTAFAIISILLFLMFALGLVLYRWLRHFEEAEHAPEVHAKMCFLASLVKSRPNPQETPLEYRARAVLILPVQGEGIGNIAQAYIGSRCS